MSDQPQGAEGAVFEEGSERNHLGLERVAELLKAIGFSVRKKSRSEGTLRVYVKKQNEYPLLNPRIVRAGPSGACLQITVLSRGTDASLDAELAAFQGAPDCTFSARSEMSSGYRYHGIFEMPLQLVDELTLGEAGLAEIAKPLTAIYRFLLSRT